MSSATSGKIKICWLPFGDRQMASSRLRCYAFDRHLKSLGISSCIGFDTSADLLVIQKRTDQFVFDCIRRFRKFSQRIIFDIDDFPDADLFRKNAEKIAAAADLVTTATPEQKALAVELLGVGSDHVAVIPNAVDYDLTTPVAAEVSHSPTLEVCWFGNWENFPFSLYETICNMPDVHFSAITNCPDDAIDGYPRCTFIEWDFRSFPSLLKKSDIVVLSHHGTEITRAKSGHKMVTSILHGVPVVASRTPDYERIARLGDVTEFLFDDTATLIRSIELLRAPTSRESYLRKSQHPVWQQYNAEEVSRCMMEAIAKALVPRRGRNLVRRLRRLVSI